MKVRIIEYSNSERLEKQVNNYLGLIDENGRKVLDIKYSTLFNPESNCYSFSAMIMTEEVSK